MTDKLTGVQNRLDDLMRKQGLSHSFSRQELIDLLRQLSETMRENDNLWIALGNIKIQAAHKAVMSLDVITSIIDMEIKRNKDSEHA